MYYEKRKCIVCGEEFIPFRIDQKTCASKECKEEIKRQKRNEYRRRMYNNAVRTSRKKRERKQDTIVGEGYAERQIAKTLASVEKIRTEL